MFIFILGFLLMASPGFAQDSNKFVIPKQDIVGIEEPVPTGDIVILRVSPIQDKVEYLKSVEYRWIIIRDGKIVTRFIAMNDSIVFGAGSDPNVDIKVFLIRAYNYEITEELTTKDDKKVKVVKESGMRLADPIIAQVKLRGPNPPVPPPNPVDPDPIFPIGRFDLAKVSYNAVKQVTALDSARRVQAARALARSYSSIASSIRAGAITNPKKALEETKAANDIALRDLGIRGEFEPWDQALKSVLVNLNSSGKLKTMDDFATAWDEIAQGLNAAK